MNGAFRLLLLILILIVILIDSFQIISRAKTIMITITIMNKRQRPRANNLTRNQA
jgi:hypothetical protein